MSRERMVAALDKMRADRDAWRDLAEQRLDDLTKAEIRMEFVTSMREADKAARAAPGYGPEVHRDAAEFLRANDGLEDVLVERLRSRLNTKTGQIAIPCPCGKETLYEAWILQGAEVRARLFFDKDSLEAFAQCGACRRKKTS